MSNIVNTNEMTTEQLALIKATVAKGASDNELQLFLYRCKSMGLDPLKPGQVHFVKYGGNPGTIIIGIDGFRTIAASTGLHSGTKRGVIRGDKGECVGAWCEVYRKDWSECAREEVSLSEYSTGKAMWAKMPETMIKKVAEVAALRMAFPDKMSGAYSHEEMDQAAPLEQTMQKSRVQITPLNAPKEKQVEPVLEEKEAVAQAQPPTPPKPKNHAEGVGSNKTLEGGEHVIKFGKYTGQMIKDIDIDDLNEYATYIEEQATANKKEIDPTGPVGLFMMNLLKHFKDTPQRTSEGLNGELV